MEVLRDTYKTLSLFPAIRWRLSLYSRYRDAYVFKCTNHYGVTKYICWFSNKAFKVSNIPVSAQQYFKSIVELILIRARVNSKLNISKYNKEYPLTPKDCFKL